MENMFDYKTIDAVKRILKDYPYRVEDVLNSLSEKQQISKDWLIEKLNEYKHPYRNKLKKDRISIMLLCSWYGMLAYKLIDKFNVKKIDKVYCIDFDPKARQIANRLFRRICNVC